MSSRYKKWAVTVSDINNKREYDVEEETAWLAIEKAMNKFRDEFGNQSLEVEIYCVQYVIGVASEK